MDKAEFDSFADEYYAMHREFVKISGEEPDFFAEYKVRDAADMAQLRNMKAERVLDFGSGVGNSVPWFRKYFPQSALTCAEVSQRSMEISAKRFPGSESYLEISGDTLPSPDHSFDLVFTACVFHHIAPAEHGHWLSEIRRVTKPGGYFIIFEHNPWNPVTVHLVNTCPIDANAKLITASRMRRNLEAAKWEVVDLRYRMFFPRAVAVLRPLERYLKGLPLGAQYFVVGRNAAP